MFERFHNKSVAAVALAVVAAMGVGGAAIAKSGSTKVKHAKLGSTKVKHAVPVAKQSQATPAPESKNGPDTDNVQSGDQNGPDNESATESSAKASGTESNGETSGTESDGPGGHADEPGNPNADHQNEGVE